MEVSIMQDTCHISRSRLGGHMVGWGEVAGQAGEGAGTDKGQRGERGHVGCGRAVALHKQGSRPGAINTAPWWQAAGRARTTHAEGMTSCSLPTLAHLARPQSRCRARAGAWCRRTARSLCGSTCTAGGARGACLSVRVSERQGQTSRGAMLGMLRRRNPLHVTAGSTQRHGGTGLPFAQPRIQPHVEQPGPCCCRMLPLSSVSLATLMTHVRCITH